MILKKKDIDIVVNGQYGQLKNIDLIYHIDLLTNLTNKDNIIISLLVKDKKLIELSKELNLKLDTLSHLIYRKNRNTGLLPDGYVSKYEKDSSVYYSITEQGVKHIIALISEEKRKEEYQKEKEKVSEQIKERFDFYTDFIKNNTNGEFVKCKETGALLLDFPALLEADFKIAEILLDNPEDEIELIKQVIYEFGDQYKNINVQVKNIPRSCKTNIGKIRYQDHINKLITVEGLIKQTGPVTPKISFTRFECPSCGNIVSMLQREKIMQEPNVCACGRRGGFKLIEKSVRNYQVLKVEELGEHLDGRSQPNDIYVYLFDNLTKPDIQAGYNPGKTIRINGIFKEELRKKGNQKETELFTYLEAVDVEFSEKMFDLNISEDEKNKIIELSKEKNLNQKLIESVAPTIYGYDNIKKALLCQLVGGDNTKRKEIHILLIGDPGLGKTSISKDIIDLKANARFISGTSSTKAGLGFSVIKDELSGTWGVQAGALPLANKSLVIGDELDKLPKEDITILHDALEQQELSVAKAGINTKLKCQTSFLATANPKLGRFDDYDSVLNQVGLPPALLNRFDLIFAIQDKENFKNDLDKAEFIINNEIDNSKTNDLIDRDLLRKYLRFAQQIKPIIQKKNVKYLSKFYADLRQKTSSIKYITPRQLQGIIRLSSAFAKLRLSNYIEQEDIDHAVNLMIENLKELMKGKDLDFDLLNVGITSLERDSIHLFKSILSKQTQPIITSNLLELCKNKGIDEKQTYSIISKLKESGDLFYPKPGYIQILN